MLVFSQTTMVTYIFYYKNFSQILSCRYEIKKEIAWKEKKVYS